MSIRSAQFVGCYGTAIVSSARSNFALFKETSFEVSNLYTVTTESTSQATIS
jgi:hypothetical protein